MVGAFSPTAPCSAAAFSSVVFVSVRYADCIFLFPSSAEDGDSRAAEETTHLAAKAVRRYIDRTPTDEVSAVMPCACACVYRVYVSGFYHVYRTLSRRVHRFLPLQYFLKIRIIVHHQFPARGALHRLETVFLLL